MPDYTDIERSFRLVTTGALGGWLGLLIFCAVAALVCLQLARELPRMKHDVLTRRVLPALRVAIVALAVWLLCQPVLVVTRTWRMRPELVVLTDGARSMEVIEEFGALHRKIDALEVLTGERHEKRRGAAGTIARELSHLARACRTHHGPLEAALADVESGLPLTSEFARRVSDMQQALSARVDRIGVARTRLPQTLADEETQALLTRFRTALEIATTTARELSREGGIVKREASVHPDVLEKFLGKLDALNDAAIEAAGLGERLQARLDELLLPEDVIKRYRETRRSRRELAQMATRRIKETLGGRFEVETEDAATYRAAFEGLFVRRLARPLSGAVYLSDGARKLSARGRERLDQLAEQGVPVYTALVGSDDAEPHDVGLVCVDMPALAVAGEPAEARVLAKCVLAEDEQAELVVRAGGSELARQSVVPKAEPLQTVSMPLKIASPGRHVLEFELHAGQADAFRGNERFVRVVDCFSKPLRVLVVSDRASADFVALRAVAGQVTAARVETVLAEPELGRLRTGAKPGEFPADGEQWKEIALAVLIGGVPDGLKPEVLDALKEALKAGLHVLVVEAQDLPGRTPWRNALGLETESLSGEWRMSVADGYWPRPAQLGVDRPSSVRLWDGMPKLTGGRELRTPSLPLLTAQEAAVAGVVPREKGLVTYMGSGQFAALRGSGDPHAVNRLVFELVSVAARPVHRGRGVEWHPLVFPHRPVVDYHLTLAPNVAAVSGLEPSERERAGLPVYRVTDQEVVLLCDGERRTVSAHRLRAREDFALTPNADVLRAAARRTGAAFAEIAELPELLRELKGRPVERTSVSRYDLWRGWWPLPLLLLLVTAEYLLRRRAGRVM